MAKTTVETAFKIKQVLDRDYPSYAGVKTFDLEKKHFLYGRIDKKGNAVYLDDNNLKQLAGGQKTDFAVNFVADAFRSLRIKVKNAANKNQIAKDSLYKPNMRIYRAWTNGDLEFKYNSYLNSIYQVFVDEYLGVDRRQSKVKNFKDFTREFVRFCLQTAKTFPVTKTGYITSTHCSPFVSGLMLEIAPESHGSNLLQTTQKYINDPNFVYFVNEAKKFGFMVDKNAPWRLVFNVASGIEQKNKDGSIVGGQIFMNEHAASYENVFNNFYRKAHVDELLNLKNKIFSFYQAFYEQFSTYEELEHKKSQTQQCYSVVPTSNRKQRQMPSTVNLDNQEDEYWLKVVLKLRMAETEYPHSVDDFSFFIKSCIDRSRLFGTEAALEYINDLTKGLPVTKFLAKGYFWYGITDKEYAERLRESKENANNPSNVNYAITATKNLVK